MKNVKQINYGIKNNFNWVVIYGEDNEQIKVKRNDQSPDKICNIEEMIQTIRDW